MRCREKKEVNRRAIRGESTTSPLGRRGNGKGPAGATGTATQWLIWQIGQAASAAADLWMWNMLPIREAASSAHTAVTATVAITGPIRAGLLTPITGDIYTLWRCLASGMD